MGIAAKSKKNLLPLRRRNASLSSHRCDLDCSSTNVVSSAPLAARPSLGDPPVIREPFCPLGNETFLSVSQSTSLPLLSFTTAVARWPDPVSTYGVLHVLRLPSSALTRRSRFYSYSSSTCLLFTPIVFRLL